jgi:predicted RecA/RadA family phage recombinase
MSDLEKGDPPDGGENPDPPDPKDPEEHAMPTTYVQKGNSIDYTPVANVAPGDVVVQGDLVGVAVRPIGANTLGSLAVAGVFDFPKAAGAITAGARLFWNDTTKVATTADAGGANKFLGKAVLAAASGHETVRARLSQ